MSRQEENEKQWMKEAIKENAVYILDVCDTYDFTHYPKYVKENEDLDEKIAEINAKEMQRVHRTIKVVYVNVSKRRRIDLMNSEYPVNSTRYVNPLPPEKKEYQCYHEDGTPNGVLNMTDEQSDHYNKIFNIPTKNKLKCPYCEFELPDFDDIEFGTSEIRFCPTCNLKIKVSNLICSRAEKTMNFRTLFFSKEKPSR